MASTITSLTVSGATPIDPDGGAVGIPGSGWTVEIKLPYLAGATFDPAKLLFTVSDPGFDATGSVTRTRYIQGAEVLRRQYPNGATLLASNDGVTETVIITLEDLVYVGSTIVGVECAAGYYGAAEAGSVSSGVIVNASTRPYYKPLWAWLNLQQERATGAGFAVEGIAYHRHGMGGQQVARVEYIGSDGTHTAASQVCSAPALSDIQTQGGTVEAWKASVLLATLDQGALCTVNAKVYPWIGDASAVLDLAADGVAWPTANPQTPLRFLCDKNGTYGGLEAWVKAGATGGTVGSRSTPYPTLIAALAGLAAANNSTKGHNDHSGSTVWLMDDGAGGAVDHGIAANIATAAGLCWTTIDVDPLATGAVRLSIGNGAARTFAGIGLYRFRCPIVQLTGHNLNGGSDNNYAMLAFDGPVDVNGATIAAINYRVGLTWMRNVALTGVISVNANPLASTGATRREQVVLALGIDWHPTTNLTTLAHTVIGCTLSRVNFREHAVGFGNWDSDDGRITANNLLLDMRAPSVYGDARAYVRGLAVVQNVFERANVANSPALQIGADNMVNAIDNLILAHNTIPGNATENRLNWLYADAAGSVGVIKRGVAQHNIFAEYNIKPAEFTTTTSVTGRVGNSEVLYGVGMRGNACVRGSQGQTVPGWAGPTGNWLGIHWDPGSMASGAVIAFMDMQAGAATATGNGDYHLTGDTNDAYDRVAAGDAVLAFDLDGVARRNDGSGSAGAYERTDAPAGLTLDAEGGTLVLTGGAAAMVLGRRLAAGGGALTLAGGPALFRLGRRLAADGGVLALTGGAATMSLGAALTLAAGAGALTLTGGAAMFRLGRRLVAEGGALSLAGGAARFTLARRLVAGGGALTLTGGTVTMGMDVPDLSLLPLASIKAYLRIDGDDEDATLLDLRAAAIEWVEAWTGHLLTRRQMVEGFEGFSGIALNAWPIVSIDSIGYLDTAGDAAIVDPATYRLVAITRPARAALNVGKAWPSAQWGDDAVSVTATAGYATADAVPRQLRQAAMMIVAGLYENREVGGLSADVERAATSLCRSYRRWAI